jgi:hypothetical protein
MTVALVHQSKTVEVKEVKRMVTTQHRLTPLEKELYEAKQTEKTSSPSYSKMRWSPNEEEFFRFAMWLDELEENVWFRIKYDDGTKFIKLTDGFVYKKVWSFRLKKNVIILALEINPDDMNIPARMIGTNTYQNLQKIYHEVGIDLD